MTRLGEAVEALARAMGLWTTTIRHNSDALADMMANGHGGFQLWRRTASAHRQLSGFGALTPHEAMIWLRCYLLGTTRVRCPDCEGSKAKPVKLGVGLAGGPWGTGAIPCPTCKGPVVECDHDEGMRAFRDLARADVPARCVKCVETNGFIPGKPTGHVDRSWAEVFLRSMPTPAVVSKVAEHWGNVGQAMAHLQGETVSETPGDIEARGQLTRLADQLQAQALEGLGGDSPEQHPDLGVWLALYLGQQKCDACKGEGEAVVSKHDSLQAYLDTSEMMLTARTMPPGHRVIGQPDSSVHIIAPCPACDGSGLAPGSHDAAMASAALELAEGLTAQAVAS